MEFDAMGILARSGDSVGLVFECTNVRCAHRSWLDFDALPPDMTLRALRRSALCSWCGGPGLVNAIHCTVTAPDASPAHVEKVRMEARRWRGYIIDNPFVSTFREGRRAVRRPDPVLIDGAHVRLGLPMCNLYSMTSNQEAMRRLFNAKDELGNQPPLPAIFPDQDAPIVIREDDENKLVRARWGWNKAKFGWVTNARNLDGYPWKFVIGKKAQRCLVPASSFAEYYGPKGSKEAVWFKLKGVEPRPSFAFAGFYRQWDWQKDGLRKKADAPLAEANAPTLAMTFLTCEPNSLVGQIHPKAMPVILTEADFETWLSGDETSARKLQRPYPEDLMEIAHRGPRSDEPNP